MDLRTANAVWWQQHQVVVFPPVSGLLPRSVLYLAVCLELGEELGRALEGELALAPALAEDQAAAGSLWGTCPRGRCSP